MLTELKKSTVKVWFQGLQTSRNLYGVTEIEHNGNMMRIKTNGHDVIVNFNNVNLMEVTEECV
jgi:hypothetical protein